MSSDQRISNKTSVSFIRDSQIQEAVGDIDMDFLEAIDVDDMNFIEPEKTVAPQRDIQLDVKLKTSFKDYLKAFVFGDDRKGNMFSRALTFIKDKVSDVIFDYRGKKLEARLEQLKEDDKTKNANKTFGPLGSVSCFDEILIDFANKPNLSGGEKGRIFVENLFLKFLPKGEDRANFDRQSEAGEKTYQAMLTYLVAAALGSKSGQILSQEQRLANVDSLLHLMNKGITNNSPKEVLTAINLLNEVKMLLQDPEEFNSFSLDVIRHGSLGSGSQFMRTDGPAVGIAARAGYEKLAGFVDEAQVSFERFASGAANKIQIAFGNPHHIIVTPEMKADATIELVTKFLDLAYGDKGVDVKNRLGDDGVQHLRHGALMVLERAKNEGKSDTEANAIARNYYQNVLLLRGLLGQVISATLNPKSELNADTKLFMKEAAKIVQLMANGTVEGNDKLSPELLEKLVGPNPSPLMSKLDEMYTALWLPKLPDDLAEIEVDFYIPGGNEEFANSIGDVLRDIHVPDDPGKDDIGEPKLSDHLTDALKGIDNPEEDYFVGDVSDEELVPTGPKDHPTNETGDNEIHKDRSDIVIEEIPDGQIVQVNLQVNERVNDEINEPVNLVDNGEVNGEVNIETNVIAEQQVSGVEIGLANVVPNQPDNRVETGQVNAEPNEPINLVPNGEVNRVRNELAVDKDETETDTDTETSTDYDDSVDDDFENFFQDELKIEEDGDVTPEDQIERNMRRIVQLGEKGSNMDEDDRNEIRFLLEDNKNLEQMIKDLYQNPTKKSY